MRSKKYIDSPTHISLWISMFGAIFIIASIVVIFIPIMFNITTLAFLGPLYIIVGLIQISLISPVHSSQVYWFKALWAIIFLVLGVWLILKPELSLQMFIYATCLFLLVEAILKMVFSKRWGSSKMLGWSLLSGIISFTIAIVLLIDWDQQMIASIGLLIGFNLLFNGLYAFIFASSLKAQNF